MVVSIIKTQPEQLEYHSEGDDVAVMPLSLGETSKWWSISTEMFITRNIVDAYSIGYGDEAFLVGRLITHDGRQKNAPIVRFGNISLMADPTEPIRSGGREQEGFLVDCRSLSGFSGSPVFVMTTQVYRGDAAEKLAKSGIDLSGQVRGSLNEIVGDGELSHANPNVKVVRLDIANAGPWLLGIDFGHMPLWKPVYEQDQETKTTYKVEANTGIACVVPAWKILDVLNTKHFVKQRKNESRRST